MNRHNTHAGYGIIIFVIVIAVIMLIYFGKSGGNSTESDSAISDSDIVEETNEPTSFTETSIRGMERAGDVRDETEARNQDLDNLINDL